MEFANAKLLNTPKGYYVAITCYKNKETRKYSKDEDIGIDMGIKTNLTLSNGKTYNITVQETDHLKKLQRQLNKKKKGSKNRYKHVLKIRKEYQHLTNIKKDLTNKVFNELSQYRTIVIQDEMIKNWKDGWFGKQIHHSILGKLKEKIKSVSQKDKSYVIISRKHKTTQVCSKCGKINKMELKDRQYVCKCGNDIDRDLNSALNILKIGLGRTESTLVEMNSGSSKTQEAAESLVQL